MQLILASQSSRRKELLSWLTDDFIVMPSDLDEDKFMKLARTPEELVVNLSKLKAKKIEDQLGKDSEAIILSADTVVILTDKAAKELEFSDSPWEVLGKAPNLEEAFKTLKKLIGRSHYVYTGFTLINSKTGQRTSDFDVAEVTFKSVSDEKVKNYIDTFQPLDKAGGYGIQELGEDIVESYQGEITAVIGLPVPKIAKLLTDFNFPMKADWQEKLRNFDVI